MVEDYSKAFGFTCEPPSLGAIMPSLIGYLLNLTGQKTLQVDMAELGLAVQGRCLAVKLDEHGILTFTWSAAAESMPKIAADPESVCVSSVVIADTRSGTKH